MFFLAKSTDLVSKTPKHIYKKNCETVPLKESCWIRLVPYVGGCFPSPVKALFHEGLI
jgi:hypothetical protein